MSTRPLLAELSPDETGSPVKYSRGGMFFLFDRDRISDYEDADQEDVITAFETFFLRPRPPKAPGSPGRGAIERYFCTDGRSFVFRRYQRGGFVARFVTDWFLRAGRSYRPVEEFRVLKQLFTAGVAVPAPLGVLVQRRLGGRLYRGALATEEIPAAKNLLDAVRDGLAESEAVRLTQEAGKQAGLALRAGIAHADLHLGNIVVSAGTKVYLLDWDKSGAAHSGSRRQLVERFARSIHKHGRSELLVRAFCLGIDECR